MSTNLVELYPNHVEGRFEYEAGKTYPKGATVTPEGINFCVYSQHADSVDLLLFENELDEQPFQVISLNPEEHKSFYFWHVLVKGLSSGVHYAYRIGGPNDVQQGYRFDKNKVLIDPYAKGTNKALWKRGDACREGDNVATAMRSAIVETESYNWEGDTPLNRPLSECVIYEIHTRGFTQSPSSGCENAGTFSAIIEKIPYLKELGVNTIELMPVFEFDDTETLRYYNNISLKNYWGYSTVSFFSPHSGYCVEPGQCAQVREFRDMVKALHKADIGIFLDVVFNHTDEGNHQGPVFSFKGFDNLTYYHLVDDNKRFYYDYTGCGNTFNCNHPIGSNFIIECLEFWVSDMHVDGFRFDEGTVLSRGEDGSLMRHPPAIWQVELSGDLSNTKLIAEAWDAAGAYQVGSFPGKRWSVWNGSYRDTIRKFVKGDAGLVGDVADAASGSSHLFAWDDKLPTNSVNFITAHDGFTLNDLVSYDYKHNDANGEDNRDGANDNLSWNCGIEGESNNAEIEALREKQIKNFAVILLLSKGVPMILAGDEVRRTQHGNNNAYCQDNEISWFDWQLVQTNAHMFRFWKQMIAFRMRNPRLYRPRFFSGERNDRGLADVTWHGCQLDRPGWDDGMARVLACTLGARNDGQDLHVMLNMYWENLDFEIPDISGRDWYKAIDTSQPSPNDIFKAGSEQVIRQSPYSVPGRSIVVLISK